MIEVLFNKFCREHECTAMERWHSGHTYNGYLYNCKKTKKETWNIRHYPRDCPFKQEIKQYEKAELKKASWEVLGG